MSGKIVSSNELEFSLDIADIRGGGSDNCESTVENLGSLWACWFKVNEELHKVNNDGLSYQDYGGGITDCTYVDLKNLQGKLPTPKQIAHFEVEAGMYTFKAALDPEGIVEDIVTDLGKEALLWYINKLKQDLGGLTDDEIKKRLEQIGFPDEFIDAILESVDPQDIIGAILQNYMEDYVEWLQFGGFNNEDNTTYNFTNPYNNFDNNVDPNVFDNNQNGTTDPMYIRIQ